MSYVHLASSSTFLKSVFTTGGRKQHAPSFLTLLGNVFCESKFPGRESTAFSMNTLIKVRNALDSSECEVGIMNTMTSLGKGSVTFS